MVALPASLSGRSLRHVQGSTSIGVFKGGFRTLTRASLDFPSHFLLLLFLLKLNPTILEGEIKTNSSGGMLKPTVLEVEVETNSSGGRG